MGAMVKGCWSWEAERDDTGHRTYNIDWLVECDSETEGPAVVMNATGLPLVGSTWAPLDDVDLWAYCTPYLKVTGHEVTGEPLTQYLVSQKFTTRPMFRCNDTSIDNPLDEPAQIRGGFIPYKEEAFKDRHGNLILSSSFERFRGPQVEVELGMPVVQISFNVASSPVALQAEYRGSVNDDTLWGLPARTIRVADATWERVVYGTCGYYYRVSYSFEIKYETWNRFILDEGSRVKIVPGATPVGAGNVLIPYKNPFTGKLQRTMLDGSANAVTEEYGDVSDIYVHEFELEPERDLMLLGIPSSL